MEQNERRRFSVAWKNPIHVKIFARRRDVSLIIRGSIHILIVSIGVSGE